MTHTTEARPRRVVIVGAGFAGMHAARRLGRLADRQVEVTLINPTDYFLYLPLLPEVTAGVLDPRRAAVSLRTASPVRPRVPEHRITAGPPSPNRLVQTALVAMPNSVVNGTGTAAADAIKTLRSDIKPLTAGTGLTEGVTGSAAQQLDSQQSGHRAEQIVLLATLVLILVLLLVSFRSPIIAILPLIVIALVSQVATGLISDVNKALHLNADSSISTILIVVLFGIGTDYILFLMFRYRERLRSGEDSKQAMASAVARVGEVISSAAGVVIVALLALLLSTLSVLRSLGPTLAIAVAVTLIAGLTLVPAVVSLLGPRVFWPSKAWRREPKAARPSAARSGTGPHSSPSSPGFSWLSWPSGHSATSPRSTCPRRASRATPSRRRH